MLQVGGDGRVLPDPDEINASRFIGLDIGRLDAPDFATFQRYLPERWPFRLHGGRGTLSGTVSIRPTAYAVDLALESDEADFGIADYRFLGDLDAGLKLGNPSLSTRVAQADGSYLRIGDARLRRDDGVSDDSWSADVELLRGRFDLIAKRRVAEHDVIDLFRILGASEFQGLLADSAGLFDFEAELSSLAWISASSSSARFFNISNADSRSTTFS